jgi:hypothetical protein
MKKTLIGALTTALVVGAASTTFAAANPFSDVPQGHWAYDAVASSLKDGVIEGYGDTTFQGDKNITRYEMAQMVAKAMAKTNVPSNDKALIDKLAAEFGDELKNLGVRVANLEKHSDNVKWNGEMRYRYFSDRKDKATPERQNQDTLLFRLKPTAEVNDNWDVHAQIDASMSLKDDETSNAFKLKQVYAEGHYGNLDLRFGKMPLYSEETEGMLLDDQFSGGRVQFGNLVKAAIEAGRWSGINSSNDAAASYQGITLTGNLGKLYGGAGYRHFNTNAFRTSFYTKKADEDTASIWSVGGGYRFDNNWKLGGAYAENTKADAFAKSGNVELDYKGASNENAGSWGAYAAYRHIGENVSFAPTYDTFTNITNKKGWEIGAEYVPLKNIHTYAYYFDGKDLANSDVKTKTIFGRVSFFF